MSKLSVKEWVLEQQSLHPKCHCGCNGEITIKKWHYNIGIPQYLFGHFRKGKIVSDESRQRMSDAHKGKNCGKDNPFYGKHHTKESKLKISKIHKGSKHTEEHKKKNSESHKGEKHYFYGKHHTEENKKKNSEAHIGNIPWNKGIPHTKETRLKISNANKGRKIPEESKLKMSKTRKGKNNGNYNTKIDEFIKNNTNKHLCKCGCEKYIKITRRHYKEGLPKFYNIHHGSKLELNGRWKGGISFDPYCELFNDKLKEKIRHRDNRICQLCGKLEGKRKLSVHHIHYDKKNCYPDLITLCTSCNSKVNQNRDYWEEFFMRKLLFRKIPTVIYNLESELNIWNYGYF